MGYISQVSGELEIRRASPLTEKPDIPAALLKQISAYGATVQVPDQPVYGLRPTAIAKIDNDQEGYWIEEFADDTIIIQNSGKAYDLKQDFEKLVAIANADGAELYGTIRAIGEEPGDVSRVIVTGTKVVEEQAKVILQWADGTTEPLDS